MSSPKHGSNPSSEAANQQTSIGIDKDAYIIIAFWNFNHASKQLPKSIDDGKNKRLQHKAQRLRKMGPFHIEGAPNPTFVGRFSRMDHIESLAPQRMAKIHDWTSGHVWMWVFGKQFRVGLFLEHL